MHYCPSCDNELPERAIYCPSCGAQAKCKSCRDILDPKARFCVSCGTPVGEGAQLQKEQTGHPDRKSLHNVIEFSEDAKSRHFRAEVSDTAINSVSQPLALFLGSRIGKQVNRSQRQANNADEVAANGADDLREYEDDSPRVIEGAKTLSVDADLEVLRRIFRRTNDNKLKLSDSRLKQDSQRDFVKRLTILFLYAHELEGQEAVLRIDLNAALSDAKVYDGNARTWIHNTDLIDQDGNSVRLALPGRDYARKALNDYLDPQIESTWSVESKSRRRTGKGRAAEKEGEVEESDKTRKGRRPRESSYIAQINKLLENNFFSESRTGKEVQVELARTGYKFEGRRINEALLNLIKKGSLTRNQNESNVWAYKNGQLS